VLMDVNLDLANTTSKFDWIVDGPAVSHATWDQILIENQSFVALASLGSIVPGWVLIVPRHRALNLAGVHAELSEDFADIRQRVRTVLEQHFSGRVFEFEHGPSQPNGLLGCGVEQAHLHMVPLDFDLVDAIVAKAPTGRADRQDILLPWSKIDADRDYWVARDVADGRSVVIYPDVPVSQGIRKIIAARTGAAESWNYRSAPFLENVIETQLAFATKLIG